MNVSFEYETYLNGLTPPIEYGDASSDDLSSEWDTEDPPEISPSKTKGTNWRKVQKIYRRASPFIQTYKNQKKQAWVQLAGHQGNFKPGKRHGTILKKSCSIERKAFDALMDDTLKPFVAKYYGQSKDECGNEFIELKDLLGDFSDPCVMDCKIGLRTYLEDDLLHAKEKPKLRKDMYDKMCRMDLTAPTEEEHQLHAVTKPRYMAWRDTISSTSCLGFRIEGIKKNDGSMSKDFRKMKSENVIKDAFMTFTNERPDIIQQYIVRLKELEASLSNSQFFAEHEVIGSSLLFVHDTTKASVWMIDFAKTCPTPAGSPPIKHDQPWTLGNHEDGYLIGLNNIIAFFEDLNTVVHVT